MQTAAVEALLGTAVEAICVADIETARKILAQLESEQIGSVCLQVAEMNSGATHTDALPSFLSPASRAINGFESSHPAATLLSNSYIADDLNAFLDLWRANPNF